MKLSEFLENANYKFIKIGTCGGSFLYCGSLKNLDTKNVDKSYRKYLRKRRNEHFDNVSRYQTQGILIKEQAYGRKVDKISRYGKYMTIDEFTKLRIDQEKERFERYKKKIKDYKPIAKRDVIEAYDSALYADCIIVIIDGQEHGNVEDL